MLLNNYKQNFSPQTEEIKPISNANTNNTCNTENNNFKRNNSKLSRLFCCNNQNNEDPCCNKGLNLSTILFFVLIFLILFYND